MYDHVETEAVGVLAGLQSRIDRRLRDIADADESRVLQQAQVHIHEALLLLTREFACGANHGPDLVASSPPIRKCAPRLVYSKGRSVGDAE